MEGNKNWAGIAALLLAGLALLIALEGHIGGMLGGSVGGNFAVSVQSAAAPQFAVLPTVVPPAGVFQQVMPSKDIAPSQILPAEGRPPADLEVILNNQNQQYLVRSYDGFSGPGGLIRGLLQKFISHIPDLLQLVGLIALLVIGIRMLNRRGNARNSPAVE